MIDCVWCTVFSLSLSSTLSLHKKGSQQLPETQASKQAKNDREKNRSTANEWKKTTLFCAKTQKIKPYKFKSFYHNHCFGSDCCCQWMRIILAAKPSALVVGAKSIRHQSLLYLRQKASIFEGCMIAHSSNDTCYCVSFAWDDDDDEWRKIALSCSH